MIYRFGTWWLGGAKYAYAKLCNANAWYFNTRDVLAEHGIWPENCTTINQVVDLFRGKVFWKPDPAWQVNDRVLSPYYLMRNGGDDCDGMAMLHAQAIHLGLSRYGYKSYIVSYLAADFTLSHHYCLVLDPQGKYWVVQPQPTKESYAVYPNSQIVFGPFNSADQTVHEVASWYRTTATWYDIRNHMYEKV